MSHPASASREVPDAIPGARRCHRGADGRGRDRADRRHRGPVAGHRALGSRTVRPGRRPGRRAGARQSCRSSAPTTPTLAPRVAVLPEHHTGWTGRPGLRGSFAGRDWSPAFTTRSIALNGNAISGFASVRTGRASRSWPTTTPAAFACTSPSSCCPSGLIRSRASVTNLAAEAYTVDELVLAFPVPRRGRRAARLRRAPQPGTGAAARAVPHRRPPAGEPQGPHRRGQRLRPARRHRGLRLPRRRGLGGAHRLERQPRRTTPSGSSPASSCSAAASCCCPARCGSRPARATRARGSTASYGVGLDEVARRFHRHLRGREPQVSRRPPGDAQRLGGRLLRPRPRPAGRARRARRRGRRRAVRAGRRLVRLPPRTTARVSATGSSRPTSGRAACTRWSTGCASSACSSGSGSSRRWSTPTPTWPARTPNGSWRRARQWPIESRYQQVLNLGVPEAYEHVKGQILAVLNEYPIDYLKWDHNRDLLEAGNQGDGGRPGVHAQTLAFYRLLDEIRAGAPGAGDRVVLVRRRPRRPRRPGAHRPDLGLATTSTRTTGSGCCAGPTQLIPPEYMGSHIASGRSHTTGRRHDLGFRAATARLRPPRASSGTSPRRPTTSWPSSAPGSRFYKERAGPAPRRRPGPDRRRTTPGCSCTASSRRTGPARSSPPRRSTACIRIRPRGSRSAASTPAVGYRVRPILVGSAPAGLRPPAWWGSPPGMWQEAHRFPLLPRISPHADFPGEVLSGSALEHVGVASPRMHPDQAVLYRADATEGAE